MPLWRTAAFESTDDTSMDWDVKQRIEITTPLDSETGVVRIGVFQGTEIDPKQHAVCVTLSRDDLRDFIEELERYTR